MEMNPFLAVPVFESSHAAEARRVAAMLADEAGFPETEAGKLAIVVTEAATNMVKHADGGELLIRRVAMNHVQGIEAIALDKGPGMGNLQDCMRDGYSTGGSPGTGMGAIGRQSAFFDIYSQKDKGTALFAQFWAGPLGNAAAASHIEVGGIAAAKQGEEVCGDGWAVMPFADTVSLMISDGLGHGDLAAQASREAARIFKERYNANPADMLKMINEGLKSTRGAAAAVIEANAATGAIRYAGVGNTTGTIASPAGMRHMVSYNGTLGHSVRKIQEFSYNWPQDSLLIFMTDGLQTQWSLDPYPDLAQHHPMLIAAVLYRDFSRGRDDATVIVAKRKAA